MFRHIESTVVADLVDKQCTNMINGMNLFETNFLITPDVVLEAAQLSLQRANAAVLRCGDIKRNTVATFEIAAIDPRRGMYGKRVHKFCRR